MKLKKPSKKQSKIIIVILSVILLLVILCISLGIILKIIKNGRAPSDHFVCKRDDIYYFDTDYEEIITDDPVYTEKDRSLHYTEYGITLQYDSYSDDMPECAKLFYKYFDTLIKGDVNGHKSLFSKNYFDTILMSESFTAQKIYDMHVTLDDRIYTEESRAYKEYYKVEYKIMDNNGSYRADLPSNISIPTEFEILRYENGAVINCAFEIKNFTN